MTYSIKLTFETPYREKFRGRDSFRLRVTAHDADGLANEIFLASRELIDPDVPDSEPKLMFQSICSAFDLSIYPANIATPGQWPPFFRVASFDIALPSVDVCDKTIEQIKMQVASLIRQHNMLDDLAVADTIQI